MAAACCLATKVLLSTSLASLCIPALPLRLQPAVSFLSITAIASNKPKPRKLGQSPCVWLPFPARADLWPLPLARFSCWGIHLLLLPPSRLSSTTPSSGKRASQSACLPACLLWESARRTGRDDHVTGKADKPIPLGLLEKFTTVSQRNKGRILCDFKSFP